MFLFSYRVFLKESVYGALRRVLFLKPLTRTVFIRGTSSAAEQFRYGLVLRLTGSPPRFAIRIRGAVGSEKGRA